MDTRPAFIEEADSSITTRTFVIRYCDEEIEINDIFQFRAEVNVEEGYFSTEFFVEADLYFVDLSKLTEKSLTDKIKEVNDNNPLKKVSSLEFRVLNLVQGVSEYLPVVFDSTFFCQMHGTIHSSLIDYRWRTKPLTQHYLDDSDSDDGEDMMPYENEADMFFGDEDHNLPDQVDMERANRLHEEYIRQMAKMYDRIKHKFENF